MITYNLKFHFSSFSFFHKEYVSQCPFTNECAPNDFPFHNISLYHSSPCLLSKRRISFENRFCLTSPLNTKSFYHSFFLSPFLPSSFISFLCSVSVWFEPTDLNAVGKIAAIDRSHKSSLKYSSPNFVELQQMARSLNCSMLESNSPGNSIISTNDDGSFFPSTSVTKELMSLERTLFECRFLGQQVLEQMFETLVVTLGSQGVAIIQKSPVSLNLCK